MKLMKKIVLAMDLSEGASDAARTTMTMARKLKANISPVHVVPEDAVGATDAEELGKAIDARLQKIRNEQADTPSELEPTTVLVGTPFERIIAHAEEQDAGAIVLAVRGTQDSTSRGLGLTASRIVRHATLPVLFVKKGFETKLRRILCPVDMSASSARALKNAVRLARACGANVTVLNVVKTSRWPGVLSTQKPKAAESSEALAHRGAELEEFLASFDFKDVEFDTRVVEGDAYEQISKTVADEKFDLLAMGTVGRGRVARLLIGGVVERLTRNPPCAMLVVKSQNVVQPQLEDELKTIQESFDRAVALLERGFPNDAIRELRKVTDQDRFYVPAWDAMAAAYDRLGDEQGAKQAENAARQIRETLLAMQIRAEARGQWSHKVGR